MIDIELTDGQRWVLAAAHRELTAAFARSELEWIREHPGEYPTTRQAAARLLLTSARSKGLLWRSLAPPRRRSAAWSPSRASTVRMRREHADLLIRVVVCMASNSAERGPAFAGSLLGAVAPLAAALQSRRGKRPSTDAVKVKAMVETARALAASRGRTADAIAEVASQLEVHPTTVRRAMQKASRRPVSRTARLLLSE